jgi:hypothetical protein
MPAANEAVSTGTCIEGESFGKVDGRRMAQ